MSLRAEGGLDSPGGRLPNAVASDSPKFYVLALVPVRGRLHDQGSRPVVESEPPRKGEDVAECTACNTSDDTYVWVNERWRVRALDKPTGLPMVLLLEPRSHLDWETCPTCSPPNWA